MRAPRQLPLSLPHATQYGRDDFVAGPSNGEALALIDRWPDWPSPCVVLSGPPGAGKTHLAHIWAEGAGAKILPAGELASSSRGLKAAFALAVDEMRPGRIPEAALFHLMNSAGELGGSLLLVAPVPAEEWQVGLPDLRSRLRLATSVALGAPGDDELRKVLVKLFADRQLIVDLPVIDFLLLRMERSLGAAIALVDALDREALAAGRRITRPMAASVLDAGGEEGSFRF